MSRPLLLIVDGESLRTPGLVSALEGAGWELDWIRSVEAQSFLDSRVIPDLLLLDPSAAGGAGFEVARRLRERQPRLPVVALFEGLGPAAKDQEPPLKVQAFLDRTQAEAVQAAALSRFQPGGVQAGPGGPHGPPDSKDAAIPDPFALFAQATSSAVVPAPETLLSTADIFGAVVEEVEALSPATRQPPRPPVPAARPTPALKDQAQAVPAPKEAEPLGSSDFTLSGVSGGDDPFGWASVYASAAPGEALSPALRPEAPGPPEAIEEYGNYFLLEKIAVGGMAELFKAQQRGVQGFQKIVAIKRILPHFSDNEDFVTMFIDEAKLAAQLTHPNIVQIFDLGKAGTSYYIAMEYVNGRDLRTLLRKVREYGKPFPEQVAAFVVMKVAAALDYAHRKRGFDDRELKLVHRDISPQNVILSVEGAVKLVDFGIAKAASKASHTVAGALKGKLLYMSPEQATGQALDNRSDLYSLGLVLFELLTGERCFQADSELGVLEKVRLGRTSDLTALNPNVSREIAAIVNKALQKSVDHRYPSARFMERDLRDYLQRQGTPILEHDVAEYMNTLLKGSREHLETLVTTRFPAPTSLTSGTHRLLSDFTGTATVAIRPPSVPPETPAEPLKVQAPAEIGPSRPSWLLPLILTLAVILVIMLVVARWF